MGGLRRAFWRLINAMERPTDLWALGLAPMLLGIIGALAALLAARRALHADPATTLRSD